jgi:NAD-dependent SIR2 family protein deacetylase
MQGSLFQNAANSIRDAQVIFIHLGAGMGADSGLSTFRGRYAPEFGWGVRKYSPHVMSQIWMVEEEPLLTWGYSLARAESFLQAEPHLGYQLLRELVRDKQCALLTSNIDGHAPRIFHSLAALVECHGSIEYLQCHANCSNELWMPKDGDLDAVVDVRTGCANSQPRCINPECKHIARFNVKLVGDGYFCSRRLDQQLKAYDQVVAEATGKRVLVLEIGAGTGIPHCATQV